MLAGFTRRSKHLSPGRSSPQPHGNTIPSTNLLALYETLIPIENGQNPALAQVPWDIVIPCKGQPDCIVEGGQAPVDIVIPCKGQADFIVQDGEVPWELVLPSKGQADCIVQGGQVLWDIVIPCRDKLTFLCRVVRSLGI